MPKEISRGAAIKKAALKAIKENRPLSEVAREFNVSRQRVHSVVGPLVRETRRQALEEVCQKLIPEVEAGVQRRYLGDQVHLDQHLVNICLHAAYRESHKPKGNHWLKELAKALKKTWRKRIKNARDRRSPKR